MSESLRDLLQQGADTVERPQIDFHELVARTERRLTRRRAAMGAAACAAVVVLGAGIAGAALSGGPRAVGPAQNPSPSQGESTPEWTPERIRDEGTPAAHMDQFGLDIGSSTSGLVEAQLYCVGGERGCDWFAAEEPTHWAVEVRQSGDSALFEVDRRPRTMVFDDDSILIEDGPSQAPRYRLLQADGTVDQLRVLSDPGAASPGPDLFPLGNLHLYRQGAGGEGQLYRVDDRAGTIQPLELPAHTWLAENFEEALWGADDCRVWWQQADGGFAHHDLDCLPSSPGMTTPWSPGLNWDGFEDWLEPGRMAMVEYREAENGETVPQVVHVTLDGGATWQRIPVETENPYAVADVLEPLG